MLATRSFIHNHRFTYIFTLSVCLSFSLWQTHTLISLATPTDIRHYIIIIHMSGMPLSSFVFHGPRVFSLINYSLDHKCQWFTLHSMQGRRQKICSPHCALNAFSEKRGEGKGREGKRREEKRREEKRREEKRREEKRSTNSPINVVLYHSLCVYCITTVQRSHHIWGS